MQCLFLGLLPTGRVSGTTFKTGSSSATVPYLVYEAIAFFTRFKQVERNILIEQTSKALGLSMWTSMDTRYPRIV